MLSSIQSPLFAAVMFMILSSPATYAWVNDMIAMPLLGQSVENNGVPTKFGLVLHAAVFFVLVYSFLQNK